MEKLSEVLKGMRFKNEWEAEAYRRQRLAEVAREFGLEPQTTLERYRMLRISGDDEALRQWRLDISGLSGLPGKRFEDFKRRGRYPSVQEALEAAKLFALDPYHSKPFLVLAGPPGVGKSHLLQAIGWTLLAKNCLVLYRSQVDLLGELRRSLDDRSYQDKLETFRECPFLLLDDLGVAGLSDWALEILDSIVDRRWAKRLPLAVATNLAATELPARIADRLRHPEVSTAVTIAAKSYRTGGKP
jgi:DNA replication protein DnaC